MTDTSLWTGRVDPASSGDARRWHQIVRDMEPDAAPGFALLGFACDEGVRRNGGREGATEGPAILRRALANLPVVNDAPLYDASDEHCDDRDMEAAQARYAQRLAALLDAGHLPIGMGGGHEIAWATYSGLFHHLRGRKPRITVVNLDAHFDLRIQTPGNSGTPFLQILQHAATHDLPLEYVCLGVSTAANTQQLFATAAEYHVKYLLDTNLGVLQTHERIAQVREWLAPADLVYLTICLDVLPQGNAPGVSAPSARGVSLEVIEPMLDAIAATGKVAVFDMAEFSPRLDRDNATARTAARLIHRLNHALAQKFAA